MWGGVREKAIGVEKGEMEKLDEILRDRFLVQWEVE